MWRTGCISGKRDECDPSSRDTKRQQVLGSGPSRWLTCLHSGWDKSLSTFGTMCQHRTINVVVFFPHSIKMQSVWLIVVSCALRQDHHQLFRPFTWCCTPITMKVTVTPICFYVCTCCGHDQAEEFKLDKIFFSSPYFHILSFLGLLFHCVFCIYLYPVKLFNSSEIQNRFGNKTKKYKTQFTKILLLIWLFLTQSNVTQ